jgi:hypothetical protein
VGEPVQVTVSVVGVLTEITLPALELIEQLCPPLSPQVTTNALPVPLVVKLEQLLALIVMLAPRAGAALNAKNALANAAPATNDVAFETNVLYMLYSQMKGGMDNCRSRPIRKFRAIVQARRAICPRLYARVPPSRNDIVLTPVGADRPFGPVR